MAAVFTEIVIDARDPMRLARWWADVLGWVVIDEERGFSWISADGGHSERPYIVFVPVAEDKIVKNRVHLDVSPSGVDMPEELERLLGLGAVRVDIGQEDVPWSCWLTRRPTSSACFPVGLTPEVSSLITIA